MGTCSCYQSNRSQSQKSPLYLTGNSVVLFILLMVAILTLGPHLQGVEGRPTNTNTAKSEDGSSSSSSDVMVDSFFDSQRHSSLKTQQNQQNENNENDGQDPRTMIVRVIVTSSSSSSSSTSSQEENPDYADATFTDFEFPVNPQDKYSSGKLSTRKTTPPPTVTTTTEYSSLPSSSTKKDVEDIFSAFYKAFSQKNDGHPLTDASHNVERFQAFNPGSASSGGGSGKIKNTGEAPFRREFGQNPSLLHGFGRPSTPPKLQSNDDNNHDDDQEHTVVKAVSSSSSSSSRGRNRSPVANPTRPQQQAWSSPPTDIQKVVAVKSVSTSTSSKQDQDDYQNQNPGQHNNFANSNLQYQHNGQHNSPLTTTTTETSSFRTSRRRQQRQRQRQSYQQSNHDPQEVQISISSSTSSDEFNPSSQDPQALPLRQQQHPHNEYQYQSPRPTTSTTTTPKPLPSHHPAWQPQIWSQPAQVWGEPAKVWGEPAKVWGEPAKVWGLPEQLWGHSSTSTSTTPKSKPKPAHTTRRPRYISRTTKYPKIPKQSSQLHRDEDYPRDAEAVEQDQEQEQREPGTFVILGDDDPETDSIDGSFDHHLGLPPLSPRPISLDQFKTFNFSYHHTFKNLNLSSPNTFSNNSDSSSNFSPRSSYNNNNSSTRLHISSSESTDPGESSDENADSEKPEEEKMFGYILEGSNVRRYRVEERTPDGFIVGEYGVLNNQNAFLRGVRYTADGTINPRIVHEALLKFLSLRR